MRHTASQDNFQFTIYNFQLLEFVIKSKNSVFRFLADGTGVENQNWIFGGNQIFHIVGAIIAKIFHYLGCFFRIGRIGLAAESNDEIFHIVNLA